MYVSEQPDSDYNNTKRYGVQTNNCMYMHDTDTYVRLALGVHVCSTHMLI